MNSANTRWQSFFLDIGTKYKFLYVKLSFVASVICCTIPYQTKVQRDTVHESSVIVIPIATSQFQKKIVLKLTLKLWEPEFKLKSMANEE